MRGSQRKFLVEGLNVERLIHRAGQQGISLMNIRRKGVKLYGRVEESAASQLCTLAEQGGWRIQLGSRAGMGRAAEIIRRRALLAAGCLLAGIAAIMASQMMWRIEVIDGGIYESDIRRYLEETGIVPICWKRQVDTASLRDDLEWRYPDVAWIETGWRGMALQIRVVQGAAAGDTIGVDGSDDVVASRDGIVASVITVAGTPQVKAGEIVRKGQVLIAGVERIAGEETRSVAARGQVMARVWDAASVIMDTRERQTVYTGRSCETYAVALPWFDLWRQGESGYEQEDIAVRTLPLGGIFFPLSIRYQTHLEANVSMAARNMEDVKGEAGVAALRKLRQKIGVSDDLVDKWVDYSMIDSEQVCAVAYGERVIDIAQSTRNTD